MATRSMTIGFFIAPQHHDILVVADYECWPDAIAAHGFPTIPVLTRMATTPEIVACDHQKPLPPIWVYDSIDELLDDEIKSGVSRVNFEAIRRLTLPIRDKQVQPGATG